jgi:hypothetical protein
MAGHATATEPRRVRNFRRFMFVIPNKKMHSITTVADA